MANALKNFLDALKNAGKAVEMTTPTTTTAYVPTSTYNTGTEKNDTSTNTSKTGGTPAHDAYVAEVVKTEPTTYKTAQEYAQAALDGTSGKYVSASQTYNALVNAGVPINTVEVPTGGSGSSSGGNVSAGVVETAADQNLQLYLDELRRQRDEKQAALDEQYEQGKRNIEEAAAESNRQAYIAYMHGMKNLPQQAAMYGNGGMAQSLANKSQLNYENNRNNIEVAKLGSLADLESDYRAGVLDAGDDYLTKLSAVQGISSTAKTSGGSSGTKSAGSGSNTVYQIGDTGVKAVSEVDLYNQLRLMGFTQRQAEDYMMRNGVITA